MAAIVPRVFLVLVIAVCFGVVLARGNDTTQLSINIASQLLLFSILIYVAASLQWSFWSRVVSVFTLIFFAMFLNIAIELTVFSDAVPRELVAIVGIGGIVALASSSIVCALFGGGDNIPSMRETIARYLSSRSLSAWTARVSLGAVAYCILYFVFGNAIYPFVEKYYVLDKLGLNLPELPTVIAVQSVRAPVYVAAVWLFVIGSRKSRTATIMTSGLALYVVGGLAPLMANAEWPVELRVYHAIEIFFQNFLAGVIISWLLLPPLEENSTAAYDGTDA